MESVKWVVVLRSSRGVRLVQGETPPSSRWTDALCAAVRTSGATPDTVVSLKMNPPYCSVPAC